MPLVNLTVDHINDARPSKFDRKSGKELPSFFDSKLFIFNMCLVKKKKSTKVLFGPKIDKRAMTALYPMARKYYTLTLLLFFFRP